MRAKEFLTESVQEVTLNDLYHDNYPDRDELIWNFVGKNDFDIPFTVRKINPLDLEELILDNYGVDDLQDLFKKMQPEQETLITDYQNDPSLSNQVIVMSGRRILDGHHRALAAVLSKKPIKFIDVSEEQPEKLDEVPLPPDWDPEKLNLRQTFKARLNYALERAKRLGGGSSRVAMVIDYEGRPTALKVAKNLRGLAQNEAEIDILKDGYVGKLPIVIPLIDYDKANKRPVWIQTEIAKKVQAPTLAKLLHSPSLWFFVDMVKVKLGRADQYRANATVESLKNFYFDDRMWNNKKPTEQDWEIFLTYVDEVADLVGSSTLVIGDLNTPSNWGVYNNRPVIIDLGFTDETKHLYGFKE